MTSQAIESFGKAVALDNSYPQPHRHLAFVYHCLGDDIEALRNIEQVWEREGNTG